MRSYNLIAIALLILVIASCNQTKSEKKTTHADLIIHNGKVFSHSNGFNRALAVKGNKIIKVGDDSSVLSLKSNTTKVIDAKGKTVLPGLIDTHMHPIRAGLNYNLELRWDGVKSLKRGLEMIREQAKRTPKGQWVRVVGGWSPHQFEEKRFPTLEELNEAAPNTPVFVLYLYTKAFVNKAALKYLKYDKNTRFPGGQVVLDKNDKPTGELIAKPSALLLYRTLVAGPKLNKKEQVNSTLHWVRELNRFGLTSVVDAGGGGFFYPEDHGVTKKLLDEGKLNIRYPFYLFAPEKGKEYEAFDKWIHMVEPKSNKALIEGEHYHHLGAGENITWAAADFENFMEPRPDVAKNMEKELKPILKNIFKYQWIFRIHATYDETITRILSVVEEIKKEGGPFPERFIIDHAETVSLENLKRIKKLGGGISIQHRMAFQGEEFVAQYGSEKAKYAPPIKSILELGIPVGSGTDATRVSTYNPFVALYWKVSGKTVGGLKHMADDNTLDRKKALYLMTKGAAWISKEEKVKGDIAEGELADFFIVNKDFFNVPVEEIKELESELTVLDGRIVFGSAGFNSFDPNNVPGVLPAWSPVKHYGGYQRK
jgi:predicted amidohydrolase YtcJ